MEEKDELLEYVANHAYFIDKIITSLRNKNRNAKKIKIFEKGIDKYIFFCYNYSRGKKNPQKKP